MTASGGGPSRVEGACGIGSPRSDRFRSRARLAVLLFPLLLYAGSLGHGFLIDDETIVRSNTRLSQDQGPGAIFGRPEQFADFTLPYYRPLTNLSYWLDSRLWDSKPAGFHLTSWLLHAGNSLLVFETALSLGGQPLPALLAGLLFAAHPMHSESVVMVQGRTDLLATLFLLLSLLAFRRALRPAAGGGLPAAAASYLCLAAALLCKETAAVWPLLAAGLLWADASPAGVAPPRRRWALLAGGLGVLAAVLLLRGVVLGHLAPVELPRPDTARLALAAITLTSYLWLLLWPFSFTFLRPLSAPTGLLEPRALGALLLVSAVLGGLVLLGRRHRLAALGVVWTLVPLLPVLNLFPIPGFSLAERYLYLPSVGFCLLLADGGARMLAAGRRPAVQRAVLLLALALLIAYTVAIQTRIAEWADPLRVYESMAARAPTSFFAQGKLGLEYQRAGRLAEAVAALARARDLEPANPVAWNNLGVALAAAGRLEEAREAYRRAVALRPDYAKAHQNLGHVLNALGDRPGAEAAFSRARALAVGGDEAAVR